MKFEFPTVPPLGTRLLLDDQPYTLERTEPYTRTDGGNTMLLHWKAPCPTCGEPFAVTTGMKGKDIPRRCEKHRDPMTHVGKRGHRIVVRIEDPALSLAAEPKPA